MSDKKPVTPRRDERRPINEYEERSGVMPSMEKPSRQNPSKPPSQKKENKDS